MRDTATTTARLIQAAPRQTADPVGAVDTGALSGFDLALAGWAFDPTNLTNRCGSTSTTIGPTDPRRVRRRHHRHRPAGRRGGLPRGRPRNQGWAGTVRLTGGGTHRVCAYAINIGAGGNTALRLRDGPDPDPRRVAGRRGQPRARRDLTVAGWSVDPQEPTAPVATHVYVTAADGAVTGAGRARRRRTVRTSRRPTRQPGHHTASPRSSRSARRAPPGSAPTRSASGRRPSTRSSAAGTVTRAQRVRRAGRGDRRPPVDSGSPGWAVNPNDPRARRRDPRVRHGRRGDRGHAGCPRGQRSAGRGGGVRPGCRSRFRAPTCPAPPGDHRVCAFAITAGGGVGNTLLGCRR